MKNRKTARKSGKAREQFDLDQIRAYMKTSVAEKFRFMEEGSAFLRGAMSPEAKRMAAIFKEKGW